MSNLLKPLDTCLTARLTRISKKTISAGRLVIPSLDIGHSFTGHWKFNNSETETRYFQIFLFQLPSYSLLLLPLSTTCKTYLHCYLLAKLKTNMQITIFEYFKCLFKPGIAQKSISPLGICLTVTSLFAQSQPEIPDKPLQAFYQEISRIYATDPILVNGTVYLENLSEIKGHPYFLSEEWLQGGVFIRDRSFPHQKLKYNIETDDVILNTGISDSNFTTVRLNRMLVDSFNIDGHQFVHSRKFSANDSLDKYFESYNGRGFSFLQRHNKDRNGKYSDNSPGGSYNEMTTANFIFKDQKLVKIRSKKEFYQFFEEDKKDIRKFLRTNHIKYRKANTGEIKLLISYISELTQPQ